MSEEKTQVTPEQEAALKEEQFKAKMAAELAETIKTPGWQHIANTLPQVLKRESLTTDKTSESFKFGYAVGIDELIRQAAIHAARKDEYEANVAKAMIGQ